MSAPTLSPSDPAETEYLLRSHAIGAAGVAILPLPLLDLALITGVQLNMLRVLAGRYGVPFSEELGRALLAALVGSGAPMVYSSMIKAIPVYGWLVGGLGAPVFAGASTYAVGRLFVQHFESGGTFLTFDPDAVREHYRELFSQGAQIVKEKPKKP
jgi:uncharacterized protein (DUF697 family)